MISVMKAWSLSNDCVQKRFANFEKSFDDWRSDGVRIPALALIASALKIGSFFLKKKFNNILNILKSSLAA